MRVAIVTESFLPQVNGVTNSVLRVCEQLSRHGHDAVVIAPGPGPTEYVGFPVVRSPSLPLPGYPTFRLARPYPGLTAELRDFAPDVVHLASPAVLGAQGAFAARKLGIPCVAVYQTDLAGFASRYRLGHAEEAVWSWLRRIHGAAARTLAPSRHAVEQLQRNGVEDVVRWARGVDLRRFNPARRSQELHRQLAPGGELLVGYVGRLAAEKDVGLLASVQHLPGVRLVIAGDGPARKQLEKQLPGAQFLGFQGGAELARTYASLDVFVHTGAHETFCQSAQEALSSGVPVVAPRAGGLLDLVQERRTGLGFVPGSAEDLARCVIELTEDAVLRRQIRGRTRASVKSRTWDAIGDELIGHYDEVLSA